MSARRHMRQIRRFLSTPPILARRDLPNSVLEEMFRDAEERPRSTWDFWSHSSLDQFRGMGQVVDIDHFYLARKPMIGSLFLPFPEPESFLPVRLNVTDPEGVLAREKFLEIWNWEPEPDSPPCQEPEPPT